MKGIEVGSGRRAAFVLLISIQDGREWKRNRELFR